jgi:hypothetical protein
MEDFDKVYTWAASVEGATAFWYSSGPLRFTWERSIADFNIEGLLGRGAFPLRKLLREILSKGFSGRPDKDEGCCDLQRMARGSSFRIGARNPKVALPDHLVMSRAATNSLLCSKRRTDGASATLECLNKHWARYDRLTTYLSDREFDHQTH